MGKVILEFDSIEEQDDIKSAIDGYKWKLAMWDLDQELRKTTKYDAFSNRAATEAEYACAEYYRDEIRNILTSYGLMLD